MQSRPARLGVLGVGLLVLTGLLPGCRNAQHGSAPADADGLQVTLTASGSTLKQGGTIDLTLRIVNHGASDETWGQGSSHCRLWAGTILDGEAVDLGPARPCTMDMVRYRLAAGDSYVETRTWDGTIFRNGKVEMLPPGKVEIFARGGELLSAPVAITLSE